MRLDARDACFAPELERWGLFNADELSAMLQYFGWEQVQ
jgi:hypothetical protein